MNSCIGNIISFVPATALSLGLVACANEQLPAPSPLPPVVEASETPSVDNYEDKLTPSERKQYGNQLRTQGFNVVSDPQIIGTAGATWTIIKLEACTHNLIMRVMFDEPLALDPMAGPDQLTEPPKSKRVAREICNAGEITNKTNIEDVD